jgi:hypothetical protein
MPCGRNGVGLDAGPILKLVGELLASLAGRVDDLFGAVVELAISGLDAGLHALAQGVAGFNHGLATAVDNARRRLDIGRVGGRLCVTIVSRRRGGGRLCGCLRTPASLAGELDDVMNGPSERRIRRLWTIVHAC